MDDQHQPEMCWTAENTDVMFLKYPQQNQGQDFKNSYKSMRHKHETILLMDLRIVN